MLLEVFENRFFPFLHVMSVWDISVLHYSYCRVY